MASRVSIVIVSFNTRDLLRRCLASIVESPFHVVLGRKSEVGSRESGSNSSPITHHPSLPESSVISHQSQNSEPRTQNPTEHPAPRTQNYSPSPTPCEIIVVDNGSVDGSPETVRSEFPQVRLIEAGENLGFARATNLGLRESGGDLVLLLNPDTEILVDAVAQMAVFLGAHPGVAAVGPALLYSDGSPQHSAFAFPTLWMTFLDLFPLHHRLLDSRLNGRYPASPNGMPFPVDHPLGAAMMIRRDALRQIGPLDEEFFMYCEEVDWSIRARRGGWQIYTMPSARVIHHSGQSTRQFREKMLIELNRSRYRLFRKHYSRAFLACHRLVLRAWLLREGLVARWMARTGLLDAAELDQRLRTYRTIGEM